MIGVGAVLFVGKVVVAAVVLAVANLIEEVMTSDANL